MAGTATTKKGRTAFISLASGEVNLDVDMGITESSGVLATEMLDFYGKWNSDRSVTELFWLTHTEINSDYFEVERAESANGNYDLVGTADAAGNSNTKLYYDMIDDQIFRSGTYYYRLKMVDLDGSFDYSDPISITVEFDESRDQEVNLGVYPNPFLGTLNLDIDVERESSLEGGLYDAIGQLIKNVDDRRIPAGRTSLMVNTNDLPVGTYLLRIKVDDMVIFEKITKTK